MSRRDAPPNPDWESDWGGREEDEYDVDQSQDLDESDEGEAGDYGDDSDAVIDCPYCSAEIHEESPRCPSCGEYLSDEDRPHVPRPPWQNVGFLLAVAAMLGCTAAGWWISSR